MVPPVLSRIDAVLAATAAWRSECLPHLNGNGDLARLRDLFRAGQLLEAVPPELESLRAVIARSELQQLASDVGAWLGALRAIKPFEPMPDDAVVDIDALLERLAHARAVSSNAVAGKRLATAIKSVVAHRRQLKVQPSADDPDLLTVIDDSDAICSYLAPDESPGAESKARTRPARQAANTELFCACQRPESDTRQMLACDFW